MSNVFIDGVRYEDLNFDPASSGGPAVSLPDYVTIDNVYYREFTSANNQTCGSAAEVPHAAQLGGKKFYPHLHLFLKASESAGTTGATFRFYWSIRETGLATRSGSVDLAVTSAQLGAEARKINLSDATGFIGSTNLGAQLAVRLDRIGGDAGDIAVMTYGIHYLVDDKGSHEVTVK